MDETVDIERYLSKKDSALGRAIKIVRAARGEPFRPPRSTDNPFKALVRAVISQGVSDAAGSTVYPRLEEIAGGKLTPAKILSITAGRIQKAGLAQSKASVIVN